jgi:hypothetical protein
LNSKIDKQRMDRLLQKESIKRLLEKELRLPESDQKPKKEGGGRVRAQKQKRRPRKDRRFRKVA